MFLASQVLQVLADLMAEIEPRDVHAKVVDCLDMVLHYNFNLGFPLPKVSCLHSASWR